MHWDSVTHVWLGGEHTANELEAEDTCYPEGITLSQVNNLGTIKVTMYKARRTYNGCIIYDDGAVPKSLDEIPEKLTKGRDM